MDNLSRKGHRQRVKDSYLKNSFDSMPDHNVLELILFYAIPQKDVKPLAYELINHFGSLENVLNADVKNLIAVDGIQEHTAILLTLFKKVNRRINQTKALEQYDTFEKIQEYAATMLKDYRDETLIVATLNNGNQIINTHFFSQNDVNETIFSKKAVAKCVIQDHASALFIAHNHPYGDTTPSASDISATQELRGFLREIGTTLVDHVIVGKDGDTLTMKGDLRYSKYFD